MNLLNSNIISNDINLSKYFNRTNTILGSGTLSSNYNNHLNKTIKRVTLKIDVSHTNHSHIIGRYGWNIKTIMMSTQCRIHFPDSNRNSSIIKSNQVSITGQLENVEKARRIIRDFIPVNMYINMDTKHSFMLCNQISSKNLIKLIHETTGANVNFVSSIHSITNSSCSSSSSSLLFNKQLNSIDYFSNYLNKNENLNFYKLNLNNHLLNQSMNKKLNLIHIYGNVDNVFLARQLITNLLPVVLIFDVDIIQGEWLENFNFTNLCQYYEVNLTIRNKPKDLVKSVVIKTTEKNIRSLYVMWELIQDLLLQFTNNKICEINNSSCLNSSAFRIQTQRSWSDDILKPNEESTKILSSKNKRKILGNKEGNKLSREEILLKYTSFSTSVSPSPLTSFSLFHHDPMNLVNRNNDLRLMSYESNSKLLPTFEHNGEWNKCGDFEENINFYAQKKFIEESNGNS